MQADAEDNIAVKAPQGIEAFKQQQTMGNGVGWQYRPPFLARAFRIFLAAPACDINFPLC